MTTIDRMMILVDIQNHINILLRMRDPILGQKVSLLLAYVKECAGQFQDALALLSDLITAQAEHVDLSFVILRAANILKHINGNEQAIEYLEFLQDEPPIADGFGKTHCIALLISLYEVSGDHYKVLLEKAYDDLIESKMNDLSAGKKPESNKKKIEANVAKKAPSKSSEAFEMLAIQAIDRCEYVFAATMMQTALKKAPNKPKILHLLAEIYLLLGEKKKSIEAAEKAFTLIPSNPDLRNLLLQINPDKFVEKVRTIGMSENLIKDHGNRGKEEANTTGVKLQKVGDHDEEEGGWFTQLAAKAKETIKDATTKNTKTPEERAKEAAEKEKQRKEKLAAKEKRKKEKEARVKAAKERKKNYRDLSLPAKPPKPIYDKAAFELINDIRSGEFDEHIYDKDLQILAKIQQKVAAAEKELADKKALIKKKKMGEIKDDDA
jgi:tetratricopeptide (TPR) repeat protein